MELTLQWACGIENSAYVYTEDLQKIDPQDQGIAPPTPDPLIWEPFLCSHPDQWFANYIRRGISRGFKIGFDYRRCSLRSAARNHPSAHAHSQEMSEKIKAEVDEGRLIATRDSSGVHISPLGLIPKSGDNTKWRLIMDLSSPAGRSVNDGIDGAFCSLKYAALDQATLFLQALGKNSSLAKLDLKSAYRMVPIHKDDQALLGLRWQGTVYTDSALPFGLRSAPKIFTAVADMLSWAMFQSGANNFLHYLDDFLFMGNSPESVSASLHIAQSICSRLHFPVAAEKTLGPTQSLVFLGIQIDTTTGTLALPPNKLSRLQSTLASWQDRKAIKKQELLSLLGVLSHAATVIPSGRIFVRHLIDASSLARAPHHFIRLNRQCRADILWWQEFGSAWNGISWLPPQTPSIHCFSDASGSWGCAALYSNPNTSTCWFQIPWPTSLGNWNIAAKELVPIVAAAAIWGKQWARSRVQFNCDNMAVVSAISSGSARDQHLRHLLRCLFFMSATWGFSVVAAHIPGCHNTAADALSRNDSHKFLTIVPSALPSPSIIPFSLQALLLDADSCWTSPVWRQRFRNFMGEALPTTPRDLTLLQSANTSNSV